LTVTVICAGETFCGGIFLQRVTETGNDNVL